MYEDDKIKIDWIKIGLRLLLILLIILLSIKLITIILNNGKKSDENDEMSVKINNLYEIGATYLSDKLPTISGEKNEVSLRVLIDENLIENIIDSNNEACDIDESYVKVTKLDNEYQYKTYLKCNNYENDLVNYVSIFDSEETTTEALESTTEETTTSTTIAPTTTTTTTTSKIPTTTKKVPTKYTVSFNTNGGEQIDSITVSKNGKLTNLPTPIRNGYTFVGWYYHGTKFDINTEITQDYVLTAKWTKN